MRCKCQACGAVASLDVLLGGDDNAKAVMTALDLSPIGKLLGRYLCLFRPAKSLLTPARFITLLNELSPLIAAQRIERNGLVYDAPLAVWEVAIDKVLHMRDSGKLSTPLKSHGYLLEIIVTETSKSLPVVQVLQEAPVTVHKPASATAQVLMNLEMRKRGDNVVAG